MFKKYMERKFSKRDTKEFNKWRAFTQRVFCNLIGWYTSFFYKIEVEGLEKLKTDKKYLIAANHMTALDPFIIAYGIKKTLAFMAKEELFQTLGSRLVMDVCGAFAVNRQKLEVSTIKTAIAIKNSNWILSIFPQGTRDVSGSINRVNRGFVALAKASKCDILPISIVGAEVKSKGFRQGTIKIKVGDLIQYGEPNETINKWCEAISKLSGLEYKPEE